MIGLARLLTATLLCASVAHSVSAQVGATSVPPTTTPLTQAEEQDLRDQIERNWNLGGLVGSPDLADVVIELRVQLEPDGKVSKIDVLNDQPDAPSFRDAADSARRAVMISSPLKLPPGKSFKTVRLRFYPGQWLQE